MSPEERQLLTGLFDRIRGAATRRAIRKPKALIQDATKAQPYAPYFLAQTVLVQDQALRAANDRLQELEGKVKEFESQAASGPRSGRIFERAWLAVWRKRPLVRPRAPVPPPAGSRWSQPPPQGGWQQPSQGYAPRGAAPGPWGGQGGSPGGGFLTGALGTAAGVAGGVLLADSIRGLFAGHNNSLGIGSGLWRRGLLEFRRRNHRQQLLWRRAKPQPAGRRPGRPARRGRRRPQQAATSRTPTRIRTTSRTPRTMCSDDFGSGDDGSYDV